MLRDSARDKMMRLTDDLDEDDPARHHPPITSTLEDHRRLARHAGVRPRLATLNPDGTAERGRRGGAFGDLKTTLIPGALFEALRLAEGWRVADLARRAGITREELLAIEDQPLFMRRPHLRRWTPPDLLRRVTSVFQLPLEFFMFKAHDVALLVDRRRIVEDRKARGWLMEEHVEEALCFLPEAGFDSIPARPAGLIAYLATSSRAAAEHVAALAAHPEAFAAAVGLVVAYQTMPPRLPMSDEALDALIAERLRAGPQTYELTPWPDE